MKKGPRLDRKVVQIQNTALQPAILVNFVAITVITLVVAARKLIELLGHNHDTSLFECYREVVYAY